MSSIVYRIIVENSEEGENMTFTAYIERQKKLIRRRHEGETYLIEKGEAIRISESERLLHELSSMKGLNTTERLKTYSYN